MPYKSGKQYIGLPGTDVRGSSAPTFIVHQVTAPVPFTMEVLFESASSMLEYEKEPLSNLVYDKLLGKYQSEFDNKFEKTFKLKEKGFDDDHVKFAKAALSNMLGGIGHFYGSSLVQSKYNKQPVPYWPASLYSAVPSRTTFPRGFLWDEGFHNLLISQWNADISMDIIGHWLDLMNNDGWIPREVIHGAEARRKVPDEFVVQRDKNANPPTLFLPIRQMVDFESTDVDFLKRIYPRLEVWYRWFNTSQVGSLPGSYRWRGRNATIETEINPQTLTSGLDDYPRASHPTDDERHVDLRCWIALASGVMADIGKSLGYDYKKYEETFKYLSDNALLDNLHWSEKLKAYSDYGLHTDHVMLKRPKSPPPEPGRPPPPPREMVRVITKDQPTLQYVNQFGYVSLFPFLLQILDPSSPKLKHILHDIRDESKMWTPYGLRSLSKTAPLYMKKNTEHNHPYWRGPIWINMNFLALRALNFYTNAEGPYKKTASELYTSLRNNLVENMYSEYRRTGYIWEQYNDSTGKGQGSHPFTGWSSLVVLVMADSY